MAPAERPLQPDASQHARRSSARRQLRAAAVLLLIAGGILGGAYGAYRLTIGRAVLSGERRHDFGNVEIGDGPVALEHTFVLTNTSHRTVEVLGLDTSCGCTVAEPSTNTLEPGDSVRIDATLTLEHEGRKTSKVFVHYNPDDLDVLYVQAWARKKVRLTAAPGPTRPDATGVLEREIIYIEYDGNDEPPAPVLDAPEGVQVTFSGWEMTRSVRSNGWPARWRGRVRITCSDGAPPEGAAVEVTVGDDQTLRLPVGQ